jgi:hypothetical protein
MKIYLIAAGIAAGLAFTLGVTGANASGSTPDYCATIPAGAHRSTEFEASVDRATHVAYVKNVSKVNCTYKIGYASYKIFDAKGTDANITSQVLFDSQSVILKPGQKHWFNTLKVPACAYQVDLFQGDLMTSFPKKTGNYNGQARLLAGAQINLDNLCQKITVTPTPEPTVTVTPTPKKEQPTVTPTPEVLGSTPTPTPEAPVELPSTGPGAVVITALGGAFLALLGKKYVA